jgi:hypothetical protein
MAPPKQTSIEKWLAREENKINSDDDSVGFNEGKAEMVGEDNNKQ